MKRTILLFFLTLSIAAQAVMYQGRVVDQNNRPIGYATVYPEMVPELGTATNSDGHFAFDAPGLPGESRIIVSFIGYEKLTLRAKELVAQDSVLPVFVLKEQPIALEETVVAAKASKQ